MPRSFQTAWDAVSNDEVPVGDIARSFIGFLPVTGASISTFGPVLGAETVSATDATAERLDEVQFDLGEGPCWDALTTGLPVLRPDFATRASHAWPLFTHAIESENIQSLFAFPLVFGPLAIGAVDLYSVRPVTMTPEQQRQTQDLAAVVSRVILMNAIQDVGSMTDSPMFSRRVIHQATGMVLAQLNITAADAHLIIQARAYADTRSMHEVAEDIVERRIRFSSGIDDIEDRS